MDSKSSRSKNSSDESGGSTSAYQTSMSSPPSVASPSQGHLDFQRPSKDEADAYYAYLPSHPILLGRTSYKCRPWSRSPGPYEKGVKTVMCTIGPHKIIDKWEGLLPSILDSVFVLPWKTINVFRMGDPDFPQEQSPVVVWVGVGTVDGGAVSWDHVHKALVRCKAVLNAADLGDVEVEIHTAKVMEQASPLKLLDIPEAEHSMVHLQPFSTAIGQSISPAAQDTLSGTLGCYLRRFSGEEKSSLLGLTCRHVALPFVVLPNNLLYHRNNAENNMSTSRAVLVPSIRTVKKAEEDMDYDAQNLGRIVDSYTNVDAAYRAYFGEQMQKLATYKQNVVLPFLPMERRVAGTVLAAPPIEAAAEQDDQTPWMRDWTLVELDKARFDTDGQFPRNTVDIRGTSLDYISDLLKALQAHPENKYDPDFLASGLIHLQGVMPIAEIRRPKTVGKSGDPSIVVGKRGATTGVTWGMITEIMAVVRTPPLGPDGPLVYTREVCVIGQGKKGRVAFSTGGDSGSVVFDLQGRFVAMLTRGQGEDRTDVTYATPMEFLLQDMERVLGDKVELL